MEPWFRTVPSYLQWLLAWNSLAMLWASCLFFVFFFLQSHTKTCKALFWSAAGSSYSSSRILLGNEGEETGQLRCWAMRKHTMSIMKPAAAGQWEQAGAIFVRCEQSIERVRPYHAPSLPSPPFLNTGNFPKELSFSLSKDDYHHNFLFHLQAGFFWKSLMASSERGYIVLL